MLRYKGAPHKLTFDEEGDAHEIYDIQEVNPEIGKEGWMEMGKEYLDGIKGRLEEDDKRDREEAREKRREKKRERKEKEKLAREGEGGRVAVLATPDLDTDDGYVSPEFDLPSASGSEDERDTYDPRPTKRKKVSRASLVEEISEEEETWGGVGGDSMDIAGDELERLAVAALGRR